MDSGLYTSATGMLTQFNAENNIADNLANLQTPGYKGRVPVLQDFSSILLSSEDTLASGSGEGPSVIGRFAGAPQIRSYGLDLAQGNPRYTGSPLDTMIVGNAFFTVRAGNQTLLTRNGSFHRAADGLLVTGEGYQVLNAAGQPIRVPQGNLSIDRTGVLVDNGVRGDRLGLARVQVGAPLNEAGSGYFMGPGTAVAAGTPGVAVLQGYLETANVDVATQTSAMLSAQRAYQADSRMLQIQDDTLGLAANELGRLNA